MHPNQLLDHMTPLELFDWFYSWLAGEWGARRDDWRHLAGLVMAAGQAGDDWTPEPPYYDPMTPDDWRELIERLGKERDRIKEQDECQ